MIDKLRPKNHTGRTADVPGRYDRHLGIEGRMKKDGLHFVFDAVPPGLFNQLLCLRFKLVESDNPDLKSRSPRQRTVSLLEIYDRLDILGHTLEHFQAFQRFSQGQWHSQNIHVSEVQALMVDIFSNTQLAGAFYAAMFLHDSGKFIRQANHSENSYVLVSTNPPLRSLLERHFALEQLSGIIEPVVRYHSLYTDTAILKEGDLLRPFQIVMQSRNPVLTNKLLFLISIIDTEAYNPGDSRLTSERLNDIWLLYQSIAEAAKSGEIPSQALTNWGKARFATWVSTATPDLSQAEEELVRLMSDKRQRETFFELLGKLRWVGLIYDLRKELATPVLRTRLLISLCNFAQKTGRDHFEFRLYREKGKWVGPQVQFMNQSLSQEDFLETLSQTLTFSIKSDGVTEIIFP